MAARTPGAYLLDADRNIEEIQKQVEELLEKHGIVEANAVC